jgi:hypothetical protein
MISDNIVQQQNKWWQQMQKDNAVNNPIGNIPINNTPPIMQNDIPIPTYTEPTTPNYTIEMAPPTDLNTINPTRDLSYLQAGSLVQYMPMVPSLGRWLQWQ